MILLCVGRQQNSGSETMGGRVNEEEEQAADHV